MRVSAVCLKLVAAIGLGCASLSAFATVNNIVVNGSFQDNNIGNVPWTYLSSVTGWTSTGPFEIEHGTNSGGLSGFNPDDKGNQYLELDSTELTTVSQTLKTGKGKTYDLSFDFSGRPDTPGGAASKVAVFWNGVLVDTVTEGAKSGWVTINVDNLVATGGKSTLSFESLGPTSSPSYGGYLDNVVVTQVSPVPETSSYAMMLLGLGMIAYMARRRRG